MIFKKQSESQRFWQVLQMITVVVMIMASQQLSAQEDPPRPITVTPVQGLAFGAFYQGISGGTITINQAGSRSSTGDIILLGLGFPFSAAIYEITAEPGTLINILPVPDINLSGSNGGSMTLQFGDPEPLPPFVTTGIPSETFQLKIGGTLTVDDPLSNPPGNYNGTFDLIFIQE